MRAGPLLLAVVLLNAAPARAGDAVEPDTVILHFGAEDRTEWTAIHDTVMGGVSEGGIVRTDRGTGIFSGTLSLENGGGFASVRAGLGARDLSAFDGLEVRVRGDGRTYQLRLRTDDDSDGVAYRAEFATTPDEWLTVRLPFDAFVPTFRGRVLPDVPPLDPAHVRALSFLLAERRAGPFSLEIDRVGGWRKVAPDTAVTPVAAVDLERYLGLWYEVAKIPNRFQDDCARGTTAEYTRREDGRIDVRNRCVTADGKVNEAGGVAEVVEGSGNARLRVSFVSFLGWRPFWGDYWIVGLDPEYRWAAVGTPSRKYGWILARSPEVDGPTLDTIYAILERNGYARSRFVPGAP